MSRTPKRCKEAGHEYWTPRPGGRLPGKFTKKNTHKIERQRAKRKTEKEPPHDQ